MRLFKYFDKSYWLAIFLSFLFKFNVSKGMIIPYGLSWERLRNKFYLLFRLPLFLTVDEEWDDWNFDCRLNKHRMLNILIRIGAKNKIQFAFIPIGG